ncbi:hypothetical protein AAFF_G00098860 [Aldrovandia affinis]|uniref:Uncharacterized protein n=1 Tax=Aldrovandia affinis TaxID=143900 RepID=A0AAD7RXU0_9TELE|nr:hypothetical protein AAFF_G00098860 [Aldrovandia affinis]
MTFPRQTCEARQAAMCLGPGAGVLTGRRDLWHRGHGAVTVTVLPEGRGRVHWLTGGQSASTQSAREGTLPTGTSLDNPTADCATIRIAFYMAGQQVSFLPSSLPLGTMPPSFSTRVPKQEPWPLGPPKGLKHQLESQVKLESAIIPALTHRYTKARSELTPTLTLRYGAQAATRLIF